MDIKTQWDKEALLKAKAFAPLHPVIAHLHAGHFPTLQECNALLQAQESAIKVHNGTALSFVPQEYGRLEFEAQYEPRCYLKGEVPTRADNWHDLLNALVWLTFPKAKAAINGRHYAALTQAALPEGSSERGAVRDAITLLDESGVIVPYADDGLAELLHGFRWKELFWHQRALLETNMGFYIFGHGLYEKTLKPYVGMTGQGLLLPVVKEFFTWQPDQRLAHLDEKLAVYLLEKDNACSTRELSPVPLLGMPGWSADNEVPAYYDNTDYFRSGRQSAAQRKPLNTAPSSVAG
ncbi:MAG: transmembrane protein [Gallionellaceae bacterium]|nr:MAG: transmembrane protein [Gallionellaceae bacterium]